MSTHASVDAHPTKRASEHYTPLQARAAVAAAYTVNIEEPTSIASLTAARAAVGIDTLNKSTLRMWIRKYGDEIKLVIPDRTAQIVADTQDQIIAQWREVRQASLERAKATVSTAGYRDVMVGAGISDDHILKRQAVPVEVEHMWRQFILDCSVLNFDPIAVLQAFGKSVHDKASLPPGDKPMVTANVTQDK